MDDSTEKSQEVGAPLATPWFLVGDGFAIRAVDVEGHRHTAEWWPEPPDDYERKCLNEWLWVVWPAAVLHLDRMRGFRPWA